MLKLGLLLAALFFSQVEAKCIVYKNGEALNFEELNCSQVADCKIKEVKCFDVNANGTQSIAYFASKDTGLGEVELPLKEVCPPIPDASQLGPAFDMPGVASLAPPGATVDSALLATIKSAPVYQATYLASERSFHFETSAPKGVYKLNLQTGLVEVLEPKGIVLKGGVQVFQVKNYIIQNKDGVLQVFKNAPPGVFTPITFKDFENEVKPKKMQLTSVHMPLALNIPKALTAAVALKQAAQDQQDKERREQDKERREEKEKKKNEPTPTPTPTPTSKTEDKKKNKITEPVKPVVPCIRQRPEVLGALVGFLSVGQGGLPFTQEELPWAMSILLNKGESNSEVRSAINNIQNQLINDYMNHFQGERLVKMNDLVSKLQRITALSLTTPYDTKKVKHMKDQAVAQIKKIRALALKHPNKYPELKPICLIDTQARPANLEKVRERAQLTGVPRPDGTKLKSLGNGYVVSSEAGLILRTKKGSSQGMDLGRPGKFDYLILQSKRLIRTDYYMVYWINGVRKVARVNSQGLLDQGQQGQKDKDVALPAGEYEISGKALK